MKITSRYYQSSAADLSLSGAHSQGAANNWGLRVMVGRVGGGGGVEGRGNACIALGGASFAFTPRFLAESNLKKLMTHPPFSVIIASLEA